MNSQRPAAMVLKASIAYGLVTMLGLFALSRLATPLAVFRAPAPAAVLLGSAPLTGLLYGLLVGIAGAILGELITRGTRWGQALTRLLNRMLGGLHLPDALLLAFLSAAGEELLFRGVLLPYAGLVASSALFGFAHLLPRRRLWLWSVWATCAGLVFGYLAQITGGVLAPIAAHFVINAVGLVSISLGRKA